ncbi:MAG: metal ABC transporter substrate-binding protein, partial [Candidatus Ranarchaeia archaeon]
MKNTRELISATMLICIITFSSAGYVIVLGGSVPVDPLTLQSGEIKIVTTISIIKDWVEQIGDGIINATSIVSGLEDPHTYEPTPSEIQSVVDCDLFIHMGIPGIEPWVQSIIAANPEIESKLLTLVNFSAHEYMLFDPLLDEYNAHVWMSPVNVKDMIGKIYDRISSLDSYNNLTYSQNYYRYLGDLDNLIDHINESRGILNGTKVVVHHPAFFYLLDLLGVTRIGIIEERHGVEPSTEHIASLIKTMAEENCHLIISQPQLDKKDVIEIARDTNSSIADLTPLLGVEGVNSYIEMINYDIEALKNPEPPPSADLSSDIFLLIVGGAVGVSIIFMLLMAAVYTR